MRRILAAAAAAAMALAYTPAQASSDSQSVGLVLSGGGSKGIAHIGVIKTLEENDIPIDYITGTSMGAIVGGLYAAGYTPDEMMQLLLSKEFGYWSTGQIDPDYIYYFATEPPSPVMLSVPISSKRDSIREAKSAVPASLISPMPMSFAFMELFSGYTAQCGGDFDRLFVPFRCVASDCEAKRKVVLRSGRLGDAIRASMSFPVVFQPTRIDSMLLYDGGIYDNFPVDVMREDFAPSIMLGVDVSAGSSGPQTSLMAQIENLVIQDSNYDLPADQGIKMRINLDQFSLLDFPKAQQIYKIGYDHAMAMMDSIKSRIHTRVPKEARELRRAVFKSQSPYVRFDSISVTGGTQKQNRYLRYLFTGSGRHEADTFGIARARASFYRAISPGRLRDLHPQSTYNDSTGLFALDLKAAIKDNFRVGFGGYVTSSTSSYVYLSAGYSTLSFSSVAASLGAWIGQSYMGADLSTRLYLRTRIPSAIELQGVVFRHKYYQDDNLFFEDKAPSFILNHEYFGRAKWAFAIGSGGRLDAGVGFGHLYDTYYGANLMPDVVDTRDATRLNLWEAFVRYTSSTLDDINYPTRGHSYDIAAMGISGRYRYTPGNTVQTREHGDTRWLQLESRTRNYFSTSAHFSLGVETDVMLSTRKLLPNYSASVVAAPAYLPTPSSNNAFNPAFRANSFLAAGIVPVYRYNDNLSARLSLHGFLPMRGIVSEDGSYRARYTRRWLDSPEFFGEFNVAYKFPFATVSAYCNYASSPARNWNVGISFGIFLLAPRFLR